MRLMKLTWKLFFDRTTLVLNCEFGDLEMSKLKPLINLLRFDGGESSDQTVDTVTACFSISVTVS